MNWVSDPKNRRRDWGMARETYEVYYYQNGRWSLNASFTSDQREEAVADGMTVESKMGYPARVVRETFLSESNTVEETVVWQGAKGKAVSDSDDMFGTKQPIKPGKATQKRAAPAAPPRQQAAPKAKPKQKLPQAIRKPSSKPKKKEEKGFFGKIIFAFLVSGTIATVSAAMLGLLIVYYDGLSTIAEADRAPLVFGTFVTVFFVALLLLLNREFKLMATVFKSSGAKKPSTSRAMQSPMMRSAKAKPATQEDEFDKVEIGLGQEEEPVSEAALEEDLEEEDDMPPDLDADMGTDMGGTVDINEPDAPAEEAPAPAAEQPKPTPTPQAPTPQAPPPQKAAPVRAETRPEPTAFKIPEPKVAPAKREQSPGETEARQIFASFVTNAQGSVQQELGALNPVSRFGLSLMLSGALSSLGQAKRLSREPQLSILKQGLTAIGNTQDRTETFCAELPGYGKNPRYTGMIQSGSKAMTTYMGGNANATKGVGSMLSEWSKPEKRPTVPSVFTFLFTDIAGSTAMTQQLGNAGAQKAVRAHNTAVRNAIARVKGKEVKHTGDGIMAVFSDSASAVTASIQMQRDIAAHNAANPTLPLVVRIGINAGEAVEEDNDYFGAAVQMTARICSKANDGHIWVSQSVVDACKGQRLGFIPRGRYEMKGIQGAKPLYEVGWTEKHKNELADL